MFEGRRVGTRPSRSLPCLQDVVRATAHSGSGTPPARCRTRGRRPRISSSVRPRRRAIAPIDIPASSRLWIRARSSSVHSATSATDHRRSAGAGTGGSDGAGIGGSTGTSVGTPGVGFSTGGVVAMLRLLAQINARRRAAIPPCAPLLWRLLPPSCRKRLTPCSGARITDGLELGAGLPLRPGC